MAAISDFHRFQRDRSQGRLIRLATQARPPSDAHMEAARNMVRLLMAHPEIMDSLTRIHRQGMDPERLWPEIQGAIQGDPHSAMAARGIMGSQGDKTLREGLEKAGEEGMSILGRPTRDPRVAAFGDLHHPDVHDALAHLWGLPSYSGILRPRGGYDKGPGRAQGLEQVMRLLHGLSPQEVRPFLPALDRARLHTGHPESVLSMIPGLADLSQRAHHLTGDTPRSQVPHLTREALVEHLGPMARDIHTALSQREHERGKLRTIQNPAGDRPDPET